MILRSGKITIKKSFGDIITKLPDEVLTQILSLLSEADATRTRMLSNRWNDLWVFLPNLHFVVPLEKVRKYYDSVDQTLARRGDMPIQKFFLDCSRKYYYNRVYEWLRIVVLNKVKELEVWFPHDRVRIRFCWDLFKTCRTLVVLTLKGGFVLDVPKAELFFPCLKKMDLVFVVYSEDKSLANLISGCPVLEELFVKRRVLGDWLNTFKFSSTSLKKLRVTFSLFSLRSDMAVIDAPNLEYIFIEDNTSIYSFTKPMSIVEAHIGVGRSATEVITKLSLAKILTLTSSTIDVCLII